MLQRASMLHQVNELSTKVAGSVPHYDWKEHELVNYPKQRASDVSREPSLPQRAQCKDSVQVARDRRLIYS
jgi:hypothetical protein